MIKKFIVFIYLVLSLGCAGFTADELETTSNMIDDAAVNDVDSKVDLNNLFDTDVINERLMDSSLLTEDLSVDTGESRDLGLDSDTDLNPNVDPTSDSNVDPVPDPDGRFPLPDARDVVEQLANERPDLLAQSCVAQGGNNEFLFELVRRLRAVDSRWGLNWKRGNVGDLSQDVIDYFWADGEPEEGRTEVYIIRVIENYCPNDGEPPPSTAWIDLTQATSDANTIGRWTITPLGDQNMNPDPDPNSRAPLPDESDVVDQLGAERPDLLAQSCVEHGGNNDFLFELVRRLRAGDQRWGLNWKRGNVGDLSQDVVDYYWGRGEPTEGSTEVYIIDVISGHCPGENDPPSGTAWIDQTEATAQAGTIGRWTITPLP